MDKFKLALFLYMIEIREKDIEFYKPYLKLYKIDEEKYMNYALKHNYIKINRATEGIELATVKELKDVLKKAGLIQTGNKEQLIERLKNCLSFEELSMYFNDHRYKLLPAGKKYLKEYEFVIDYHNNFKATDKFTLKMIGEKAVSENLTYYEAIRALQDKKIADEESAKIELKDSFGKGYLIAGVVVITIAIIINILL